MVASSGTSLASGTRVSLRYVREQTRNTTPAALSAAVDSVEAEATSSVSGSGHSEFKRASGSFITDGFIVGQTVRSAGFTNAANNGDFVVTNVAATILTVRDASDDIVDEAGDAGNTVRIMLKTLRATGRNINLEKNVLESQEVDPDGMETDNRHGFNRVVGSPGFQLSRADYDDFIQFTFGRDWENGFAMTGSPNLASNHTNKTFTRSAGSFITDGFRVGDIVDVTGFSGGDVGMNSRYRVTAVTATVMTVLDPSSLMTTVTAASGRQITLPGKRIDLGTEMQTFLIERLFSDVTQHQLFNGCAVDQFSLNVEPESIINGTFNILGMSAAAMSASPVTSVAALAATSNSPFAAFDGQIFEGGAATAVATSVSFSLARNRSLNPVVGSKTSPDVFEGTARISGTLSAFFENATLFNKFVNETESTLFFRFDDSGDATQFMNIVFPRVKYNGGSMDPPQEGPVPLEMPFVALKKTGLAVPGGTTRSSNITIQVTNAL